jgi:hypothetical protein
MKKHGSWMKAIAEKRELLQISVRNYHNRKKRKVVSFLTEEFVVILF